MNEPTHYPRELLESADALTKLVGEDLEFDETMGEMAKLAAHAVGSADECTISLAAKNGADFHTVATTGDVGRKLDDFQRECGEGPCLSSVEDHQTFRIADMAKDETWPKFSRKVSDETEINSMLSFVLRLSDDATGALNFVSQKKDAFSPEDVGTGTIFAAQAAIALGDALGHKEDQSVIAQLEEGMKTRQMIGQAVGILMATQKVGADEAFTILRKASQNANIKLRDIAQRLVEKAEQH
ncbi:MAG: GAF and ANTAR domain-containing protein [Actinomycetota bacterium]|nr:GAF and ANTAR domain-containing protein [Actinomycetota bacterium]